ADTGICGAMISITPATASDNCSVGAPTGTRDDGEALDAEYPVVTTTITWTATDIHGNEAVSLEQTVTVTDNEAPELYQVADINQNVDEGSCGAVVNFEAPSAYDNCSNVTVEQTGGPQPGTEFPVGTTPVEYTATDSAGNSSSISFTVTVTDNLDPVIECPSDIVMTVEYGSEGTVVNYDAPAYSDNCEASIEQTAGLESGSMFPVGKTTIEYTVTDAAGNTTTCSFTVTVNAKPDVPAVSVTQPDCATPTGSVSVTTEAGLTYSIDGSNYQTSGEFSDLPAGTYAVTTKDENGNISAANQVTINAQPATPAAPVVEEMLQPTCAEPTGSVMLSLIDGISYSIEDENGNISADTDADGIFDNLAPGTYTVTASSAAGCISEATSITVDAAVPQEIETTTISLCTGDTTFDLFDLLAGEYNASGTWEDPANTGALNDSFIDPAMLEVGNYTFNYITEGACATVTAVQVNINDDCIVLPCGIDDIKAGISKVVTPNGDQHNDTFKIDFANECGFTFDLKIFNRWGAKVYETENYQNDWDGYSSDSFTSSNQLPSGTYYYVIEVRNSEFEPIQGYIYLGSK
ncbi:MAG: HYR domain-containing protein, partial [Salegentibacter sp.]